MIWVNVDKPTRDCCIHANPDCREILRNSVGTAKKGSGQILENGGWMPFLALGDAQAYAAADWPRFVTHTHC